MKDKDKPQEGWTEEEMQEQLRMQDAVDKAIHALPHNEEPLDAVNRRRAKAGLRLLSKAEYERTNAGQ